MSTSEVFTGDANVYITAFIKLMLQNLRNVLKISEEKMKNNSFTQY